MIEETGRVIRVHADQAWVETTPQSTCGGCSAHGGCGIPVLARILGRRSAPVCVANHLGVAAGDRVVIGISETGLVRGSLAVYLVPLAGLLLGATGARWLALSTGQAEAAAIIGGLAGFLAGLAWVRRFSRRIAADARYQAVLVRQVFAVSE